MKTNTHCFKIYDYFFIFVDICPYLDTITMFLLLLTTSYNPAEINYFVFNIEYNTDCFT